MTRQLPLLNQNVERFVETEGMPFHEAQTLAKRHMRGEAVSSASVARAFAALLEQIEALEADQAARRRVQQQWMVSQLTYKMLYLHHTTQNPALSAPALRAQKGRVRARVLALLDAGRSYDDIRMADLRFEDDAGEA